MIGSKNVGIFSRMALKMLLGQIITYKSLTSYSLLITYVEHKLK